MKVLRITLSVRNDLADLFEYGRRNFGIDCARQYNNDLLAALLSHADNEILASQSVVKLVAELPADAGEIQFLRFKSHYIFYRDLDDHVLLLSVQRQGRDLPRIVERLIAQLR